MNPRTARRLPLLVAAVIALFLAGLLDAAPGAAQSANNPPPPLAPRGRLPQLKTGTDPRFEMVLIHGLGGAASEWDGLVPYLMGTFKVGNFELAGHGKTQPVMDPTVESEAERLGQFLRTSGLTYPTLVGHGMGGMIALQYTLDHPNEVHRLILVDTAPRQLAAAEQKLDVGRQLVEDYDGFVGRHYALMSPDDEIAEHILDMALRTHAPTFVSLLMSSFDFDLTPRLSTLSAPLLVIGSELMFPDPEQTQPRLSTYGFDQARSLSFKRFGKTGHYIMLDSR
ncbi:MAG: alpha/beta hydrolase [Betaproteobacteria bacterium]|nr:alpha/beta hydrolase [Betaproteobacteria bacterium]